MTNETQVVAIDITNYDKLSPEQKRDVQDVYEKAQDRMVEEIVALSKELEVSEKCAADIMYLRTRFRHTPELEAELIRLHKEGIPVNVYEFGVTEQTQRALMEVVEDRLKARGIDTLKK